MSGKPENRHPKLRTGMGIATGTGTGTGIGKGVDIGFKGGKKKDAINDVRHKVYYKFNKALNWG